MASQAPIPPPGIGYQPKHKRGMSVGQIVLIVVIVVLIIPTVLLIGMALAVPAMQSTIRRANETSVIASLRELNQMEGQYSATYPQIGFTCSLSALSGRANSGAPSANAAQLIPADLASGSKSGYAFTIVNCANTTLNNTVQVTSYEIVAVPNSVGRSGNRGFCTDETAQIRYDPKGGNNCTELLQ